MPNTQTGPYPVIFAKNATRARINLQTRVGGTQFRRSLGPGETKEVPWVIAKSAGFHRLWTEGKLEVSDKFDFETTLDELPSIGADGGPAKWEEIEGAPEVFPPADHDRAWDDITGKPPVFPPDTHTHVIGDTTGLQGALDSKVGNSDPRLTDDRTPTDHTHTIANVTGLQDELNGKASATDPRFTDARTPVDHDHDIADVTGLQAALNGKAASSHTHTIANVTDLQTALDGKVDDSDPRLSDSRDPNTHTHSISQVTGLQGALDGKSATGHSHAWAEITDKPAIPTAAASQDDSEATDVETLVANFNELLGKLRDAGIIES